jgi:hypothetical protein
MLTLLLPAKGSSTTGLTLEELMSNTSIPSWMLGATWDLVDPGDAGALDNAAWGTTRLVTSTAETRTLAIPTKVGLKIVLVMETDGGDCVVTVGAPGYDENSTLSQTLTFADPGQFAVLESMVYGTGTYAWRLTSYEGCTGPSLTADDFNVTTVTASGLVTMSAAATVGTTLAVTGTSTQAAINASGLIAAAAAVTVGTTLGVTGTSTQAAINASGAVAAASTLDVVGTSTLNVTEVDGTLTIKDGGTVTQGTSTVTTVVLNTNSGQITTFSSVLAAAGEESFTVTNSTVTALSTPIVCLASTSSAGTPHAVCTAVAAGSFVITVTNLHASAAMDNTCVINFNVILGSSST